MDDVGGYFDGSYTVPRSIIRSSNIADCNWEDGHLGNSEYLYFTPTDFRVSTASSPLGIDSADPGVPPASGGPDPFVIEGGGFVINPVAIKLIPKGFRIKAWQLSDPDLDGTPQVFSAAAGPLPPPPTPQSEWPLSV